MSGRYAARNRRSVPMELPHSGTLAGSGTFGFLIPPSIILIVYGAVSSGHLRLLHELLGAQAVDLFLHTAAGGK